MREIRDVRSKLIIALAAPVALIAGCLLATPAYSQTAFDVPCKDPRGCPDLVLNATKLEHTKLETVTLPPEDCSVQEGQVGGAGTRRLLKFPYSTPNLGPGALIIGDPLAPENSSLFEFGACHGHYHFNKYAAYRLWKPADFTTFQQLKEQNPNQLSGDIIASNRLNPVVGTKRGFCVIDYSPTSEVQGKDRDKRTYTDCGAGTTDHGNQGLGVGWADTYVRNLPGQWIDVTTVSDGDYILDVETNPDHSFEEVRYDNNSVSTPVKVTH